MNYLGVLTFSIVYYFCILNRVSPSPHLREPTPRLYDYQVFYQWKQIDYEFANASAREEAIKSKKFIPENCAINVPAVYKNRLFLTTPRYKPGVPATISVVPYSPNFFDPLLNKYRAPALKPFPSWDMQKEGDCTAFQLVQSMTVDQFGRLWIADVGRTNLLTKSPRNLCPAKLVVMDLNDNDKIVSTYDFPHMVVSRRENAIKDMQVACTSKEECFVYISDIFQFHVVIYDHKNKKSWSASHESMTPKPQYTNFTIAGTPTCAPFGVAGSAVSPKTRGFDTFYYSPIADLQIYAVNASYLQKPRRNFRLGDWQVMKVGMKPGQSDGWAMDNTGKIFFGSLPENAVYFVETSTYPNATLYPTERLQSSENLQWPDTFTFDNNGWILFTSNKFQLYDEAKYDFNQYNFRVLRFLNLGRAYNQDYCC